MKMTVIERLLINTGIRNRYLRRRDLPELTGGLVLPDGAAGLELGCGNGSGAKMLRTALDFRSFTAVDVDPAMTRAARRSLMPPSGATGTDNGALIHIVTADAARLPFPPDTFDAVFHLYMLEHIAGRGSVLAEVMRVLKPGGVYRFRDVLVPDSPFILNRFWGHVPLSEETLSTELGDTGFSWELVTEGRFLPRVTVTARKPS